MKKLIIILCFLPLFSYSGNIYKALADTVFIGSIPYKTATGELIIFNSTKDTAGVLYNNGSGVTQFKKVRSIKLNDSTYVIKIGTSVIGDTIKILSSASSGGTVTDFTFTDGNGFDGTVTNSTTTPTLVLVADTLTKFASVMRLLDSITAINARVASKGSGTVTNVGSGYGTNFSAITSTGSIIVDSTVIGTKTYINTKFAQTAVGTVTSVATDNTLTGGTITSTGTLKVDTSRISTKGNVTGLLLNKQDNLISGTTIKTINSTSLLGSGNITTPDAQTLSTSYGSDSITLSISGGNSIKFAYAVDSVGMVSTDSLITYKAGVRRSYKVGSTGGGGALSAITAATATNTIDNTNYKQRWNWSTTAGDTAFALLGNSTGAASNLQNVLTVSNSGANTNASQTTFGAKISNTKTGTSSINYGLYAKASGGTANCAIGADGDVFVYTGFGYKFQSGGSITDGGALQITAGTNRAIFLTPTKAEGVDILTSAGYISHNFYEVSGTDAGIIMGGRYNAGTYDPFSTTAIVQLQRQSGKLNFIAATGLAGSYTPSSYTIMTVNGTTSGAAGNVGIGTTSPSANAKLEITTTTLAPIKLTPMTATQASAVTAEDGQILYVNSTNGTFTSVGFWGRENGVWVKL